MNELLSGRKIAMKSIVRVICRSDSQPTPHDGRYVVAWNPHTPAGVLELTSTDDKAKARRFDTPEAFAEWQTISEVEPIREWDRKPNRPLTGITIEIERVPA